jgi:hypothetical protein
MDAGPNNPNNTNYILTCYKGRNIWNQAYDTKITILG